MWRSILVAAIHDLARRLRVGNILHGRNNVVIKPAAVVVGDKEHGFLPLGTGAQGLVDVLEQSLTLGDVVALSWSSADG